LRWRATNKVCRPRYAAEERESACRYAAAQNRELVEQASYVLQLLGRAPPRRYLQDTPSTRAASCASGRMSSVQPHDEGRESAAGNLRKYGAEHHVTNSSRRCGGICLHRHESEIMRSARRMLNAASSGNASRRPALKRSYAAVMCSTGETVMACLLQRCGRCAGASAVLSSMLHRAERRCCIDDRAYGAGAHTPIPKCPRHPSAHPLQRVQRRSCCRHDGGAEPSPVFFFFFSSFVVTPCQRRHVYIRYNARDSHAPRRPNHVSRHCFTQHGNHTSTTIRPICR